MDLVSSQPLSSAPGMRSGEASTSTTSTLSSTSLLLGTGRSLTISRDSTTSVWKPIVEEVRSGQEAGSSKVLRILEHQEEVHVANEDTTKFHHSSTCNDEVEGKQDPGKVHCLELCPEPEVDDGVLVELTPDVHH